MRNFKYNENNIYFFFKLNMLKILFYRIRKESNNPTSFFQLNILFLAISLMIISCSNIVYNPTKETYYSPKRIGFLKRDIQMKTSDGNTITGWSIYPKSNFNNTVVLQLHGNGENQSSHFLSLVWMVNYGYELVTYDYRGYGNSTGKPERSLIHQDTLEFISLIHKDCVQKNKKLILYGQSMGGAIALRVIPDLKDKSRLVLVIVEGSFISYRKVVRSFLKNIIFEPFPFLLSYLIPNQYSPEEVIDKISPLPVIVVHELEDPIVPFENGKELFKNLEQPKQFWEIRSSGHIQWMQMGRNPNAIKLIHLLNQFVQEENGDLIH
jgi:uncharacterized protein